MELYIVLRIPSSCVSVSVCAMNDENDGIEDRPTLVVIQGPSAVP